MPNGVVFSEKIRLTTIRLIPENMSAVSRYREEC